MPQLNQKTNQATEDEKNYLKDFLEILSQKLHKEYNNTINQQKSLKAASTPQSLIVKKELINENLVQAFSLDLLRYVEFAIVSNKVLSGEGQQTPDAKMITDIQNLTPAEYDGLTPLGQLIVLFIYAETRYQPILYPDHNPSISIQNNFLQQELEKIDEKNKNKLEIAKRNDMKRVSTLVLVAAFWLMVVGGIFFPGFNLISGGLIVSVVLMSIGFLLFATVATTRLYFKKINQWRGYSLMGILGGALILLPIVIGLFIMPFVTLSFSLATLAGMGAIGLGLVLFSLIKESAATNKKRIRVFNSGLAIFGMLSSAAIIFISIFLFNLGIFALITSAVLLTLTVIEGVVAKENMPKRTKHIITGVTIIIVGTFFTLGLLSLIGTIALFSTPVAIVSVIASFFVADLLGYVHNHPNFFKIPDINIEEDSKQGIDNTQDSSLNLSLDNPLLPKNLQINNTATIIQTADTTNKDLETKTNNDPFNKAENMNNINLKEKNNGQSTDIDIEMTQNTMKSNNINNEAVIVIPEDSTQKSYTT